MSAVFLLNYLREKNYHFTTVTPLSHSYVFQRKAGELGTTLRDIFGWSFPFHEKALPSELVAALESWKLLKRDGEILRSSVRVSTIGDSYFMHSAYPTKEDNSVFFGPDTYRFVRFMKQKLTAAPAKPTPRILDIGCGSGAGGLMMAGLCQSPRLVLNDINPLALKYASMNAEALGLTPEFALGDSLSVVSGEFDLILANPPFLVDEKARTYRHGGDKLGRALALRMIEQSLSRLASGGRMLLYTGVAIVDGVDGFLEDFKPMVAAAGCTFTYEEIDPDIFGEELDQPAYREVDRIAAVGLVIRKP